MLILQRAVQRCVLGSMRLCGSSNCKSFRQVSSAAWTVPHPRASVRAAPSVRWQHTLPAARAVVCAAGEALPAIANAAAPQLLAQLVNKLPQYCCGCGVKLQQTDPDAPGYFIIPKRLLEEMEQKGELSAAAGAAEQDVSPEEAKRRRLDRQAEAWLDTQQRPANAGMAQAAASADEEDDGTPAILCARCHSLTHYGRVKSESAEAQLPEFDLAKKVGRKIALQKDRRALVLVVVDVWDFDGSLPRAALASLFPGSTTLPANTEDLPFQLAVAVNKFDLLPSQATAGRVEGWVRLRLKQAGLPKPSRVFMVSAVNGFGVKDMVRTIKEEMGFRADLWVVGAQNAGKSSLIAAMKRLGGTAQQRPPTIAPVPGTTLGLLRVPGIPLGPKHRTFDTPGVHHAYQLTSRLDLEELAMVLPRKKLKARTYRLGAGSCISIGGLAQVDVVACPGATIYLTVFVADTIVTHMGKIEGAQERREKHVGGLLVPPMQVERLAELGPWTPRQVQVAGDSWTRHSKDIAIAGLGWIAVGVSGTTELCVHTTEGVSVTVHDALIPDYAKDFQRPGFSRILPSTKQKQAAGAGSDSKAGVRPSRRTKVAAAAAAAAAAAGGQSAQMAATQPDSSSASSSSSSASSSSSSSSSSSTMATPGVRAMSTSSRSNDGQEDAGSKPRRRVSKATPAAGGSKDTPSSGEVAKKRGRPRKVAAASADE